jgi:hypothetical protein
MTIENLPKNISYLSLVRSVQSTVLKYGHQKSGDGAVYSFSLDSFFEESSVTANSDVYEIWFGELSNAVVTPLYNGHHLPTGALVTLIQGDGWNVNTLSYNVESLDLDCKKECNNWLLENLK